MIRQHLLQQQRLNSNHDRLLGRYQRLLTPSISQFPAFGTSSLPGRNYDEYLKQNSDKYQRRGTSLAALSRANVGSSSETYRWMGGEQTPESLPRNVDSVLQHSRQQSMPLVHAEKFEPVKIYEHPLFGPTPAYLRPVLNEQSHVENIPDNDSEKDGTIDNELQVSPTTNRRQEPEIVATPVQEDKNSSDNAPRGYISYQKWKAKHEDLIPVDPLLYNIYTQRSNRSIDNYGQSFYSSLNHSNQPNRREEVTTPTPSEVGSVTSDVPRETSPPANHQYHRLKPRGYPAIVSSRLSEYTPTGDHSELPNNGESPPDSPVPYLSKNRPNLMAPSITGPLPSTLILSSPTIERPLSSVPIIFPTTGSSTGDITPLNPTNIPVAPPMPTSLLSTSSTPVYQTPSSLSASSTIRAPPMPTSNSIGVYQSPSSLSFAGSTTTSTPKAVTFGTSSSIVAANNDETSSSDSEDEEKRKRKRRKQRQAAGGNADSSSSDD